MSLQESLQASRLYRPDSALLRQLVKTAFLQDGIMAPSQVIQLAVQTDLLLDKCATLEEDNADLRQNLSDFQHTRPPYL